VFAKGKKSELRESIAMDAQHLVQDLSQDQSAARLAKFIHAVETGNDLSSYQYGLYGWLSRSYK
jgi:hypothetical protein